MKNDTYVSAKRHMCLGWVGVGGALRGCGGGSPRETVANIYDFWFLLVLSVSFWFFLGSVVFSSLWLFSARLGAALQNPHFFLEG